ncbi:MAG: RluA family pseudouridine synthase [Planctomycetes bacterium]|nr:RluA family pseudouridine synthase [Planctomycetota bacterium]
MHEIELTGAEDGQRLDRHLRKLLPHVPLGGIFKLLRRGTIRIDGRKAKPDLRLTAGMVLTLPDNLSQGTGATTKPAPPVPPAPRTLRPRIVHRDDALLVVDKPAGLPVQPGSGHDFHLCGWLDAQPFGVRTATYRPAPVHRLDRGTSGLLVAGLTPQASRALSDAFREDAVSKVYAAVVEGVPTPPRGTIDAPLWLRETARAHQPKVHVDERGKPAISEYEVLEAGPRRALLRVVLRTGRTHQIRAHLAHLGHPIVGDARYGSVVDLGRGQFLLHAMELALPHPDTGERMAFTSPVPARLTDAIRQR